MSAEAVDLDESGGRTLREVESLCWRLNTAIVGADHLLAGALLLLTDSGRAGLPSPEVVEAAVAAVHGWGEAQPQQVMFGSGARAVIEAAARAVRLVGGTTIRARDLALAALESGEVNPMFLGTGWVRTGGAGGGDQGRRGLIAFARHCGAWEHSARRV